MNLLIRMQCWPFAFKPQLLAPQRAQVSLTLRVRRGSLLSGCGRGTGEDRLGEDRPLRCERGIRGGSVRSRRTRAHDLSI